MVAYYCFVNLGWAPSQYDNLLPREKLMVTAFAVKAMKDQKEEQDKIKQR